MHPTILTAAEIAALLYPGQAEHIDSYSSHQKTKNTMQFFFLKKNHCIRASCLCRVFLVHSSRCLTVLTEGAVIFLHSLGLKQNSEVLTIAHRHCPRPIGTGSRAHISRIQSCFFPPTSFFFLCHVLNHDFYDTNYLNASLCNKKQTNQPNPLLFFKHTKPIICLSKYTYE